MTREELDDIMNRLDALRSAVGVAISEWRGWEIDPIESRVELVTEYGSGVEIMELVSADSEGYRQTESCPVEFFLADTEGRKRMLEDREAEAARQSERHRAACAARERATFYALKAKYEGPIPHK